MDQLKITTSRGVNNNETVFFEWINQAGLTLLRTESDMGAAVNWDLKWFAAGNYYVLIRNENQVLEKIKLIKLE